MKFLIDIHIHGEAYGDGTQRDQEKLVERIERQLTDWLPAKLGSAELRLAEIKRLDQ